MPLLGNELLRSQLLRPEQRREGLPPDLGLPVLHERADPVQSQDAARVLGRRRAADGLHRGLLDVQVLMLEQLHDGLGQQVHGHGQHGDRSEALGAHPRVIRLQLLFQELELQRLGRRGSHGRPLYRPSVDSRLA